MQQQMARAAQLLGASKDLLETIRGSLEPTERVLYEQTIAAVQAALDEGQFATAWAAGRAMALEQAVAYARSPLSATSDSYVKS
jgi:hypothetical protein